MTARGLKINLLHSRHSTHNDRIIFHSFHFNWTDPRDSLNSLHSSHLIQVVSVQMRVVLLFCISWVVVVIMNIRMYECWVSWVEQSTTPPPFPTALHFSPTFRSNNWIAVRKVIGLARTSFCWALLIVLTASNVLSAHHLNVLYHLHTRPKPNWNKLAGWTCTTSGTPFLLIWRLVYKGIITRIFFSLAL